MNTTKITSFTAHQTAEGMRLTYTYSVIDSDGNLVRSNERGTCIVMDADIDGKIAEISSWLLGKVVAG